MNTEYKPLLFNRWECPNCGHKQTLSWEPDDLDKPHFHTCTHTLEDGEVCNSRYILRPRPHIEVTTYSYEEAL